MNCRGAYRRLSAFIDNALSPGIYQAVAEHLKGCPSCRRKLAEIQAISENVSKLPPLEVSEGFADRVVESVKSNAKTKEVVGKTGYRFAFASAAFTVAAASVFFIFGTYTNDGIKVQSSTQVQKALEVPDQPELSDFADDPSVRVWSVPVPADIRARDIILDDSLLMADTASMMDEFLLPEVDRSLENVNIRF